MAYYKKPYPKAPPKLNADGSVKKKSSWNPNYKKSTVVPGSLYKPLSNPDEFQKAIIDHMETRKSLIVDSYAGTGKTTVCVESMHSILRREPKANIGYLIFAARNKEEAIGKCPPAVTCKTMHGFGLGCLSAAYGKIEVSKDKNENIATAICGPEDEKAELRYSLCRAMDLGKDYLASTVEEISAIVDKHGIETCGYSDSDFATKVLEAIEVSVKQVRQVSFSDMTYLPIRLGLTIPTFDYTFLDESNDLNPIRIELGLRTVGPNTKLVSVGDMNQQIFAFTGSDEDAMNKLKERSNAEVLNMHRTYRCGKAIVEMAKMYVADYEAAPSNEEGEVVETTEAKMMDLEGVAAGDFVLSRTNAPLIGFAMNLLMQGRKCNIQGRDIGKGLLFMIRRSEALNVDSFLSWLAEWSAMECERLGKKNRPTEHITDRAACMQSFCEGTRDIEEVKRRIKSMFDDADDDTSKVVFSTVHRSKGLERNRVWLLENSFVCKPKTPLEVKAEANLRYVAITRSRSSLFLVS